jgi:hypothetical protein
MYRSTVSYFVVAALVGACSEPASVLMKPVASAAAAGVTDPTATWKIPLDDGALSLRSDGLFPAGGFSVYADGVCRVAAKIFATTALSNTGDATIELTAPRGNTCGRRFRLVYPDGGIDAFDTFSNLNALQSTSPASIIPVGETAPRRLILGNATRCGRMIFGDNGRVGAGTDKLNATRVDARTWHLQSGAPGADRALCESTGVIYNLQVSFDVVASRDLPVQ